MSDQKSCRKLKSKTADLQRFGTDAREDTSDGPTEKQLIEQFPHTTGVEQCIFFDVSRLAREIGLQIPVAVTRRVWKRCVGWGYRHGDDVDDRISGLLMVLADILATRTLEPSVVFYVKTESQDSQREVVWLEALLRQDDLGRPVVNIILREE